MLIACFSVKVRTGSSLARSPTVRGSPVVNGSRFRRLWSIVEGSSSRGGLICVVLCVVVVVRVVVDVVVVVVLVSVVVRWWLWYSRVTVNIVVGKCRGFPGHLGPASVWPWPGMSHWNIYGCICVCMCHSCCDVVLVFGAVIAIAIIAQL